MKKVRKGKSIKQRVPATAANIDINIKQINPYTVYDYDELNFDVHKLHSPEEYLKLPKEWTGVRWISVEEVLDNNFLSKIGELFKIHPLVIKDIINTDQRPKIYDYDDYSYITAKLLYYDKTNSELVVEQISIILKDNLLISFQEEKTDFFNPLLDRLKNGAGRIRKLGADFLMYALLDTIVDNYFTLLEDFEERMDEIELLIFSKPVAATLNQVQQLKRELIYVHKSTWPLREVIGDLQRVDSRLVKQNTTPYLRDIYEHVIQVMDTTDTLRDILSTMFDIYLSSTNNKMNEVMKILTIFSSIFMPITFIAGLYGMNFKYMPELNLPWAYPAVLVSMALISAFMLLYFRKRKWM